MCRSVVNTHVSRNGTQAVPYKDNKKQHCRNHTIRADDIRPYRFYVTVR